MIRGLNMAPGPADFSHLIDPANEGQLFPHWSGSCKAIYEGLRDKLRTLLGTANPVLLMMTSGTGAIEALLTNALSVGDKVLVLSNGFFGDKLFRMALSLGLDPIKLHFDWERPIDVKKAKALISSDEGRYTKAVLMVHLETSTGILNELAPIGQFLGDSDTLFLVDAISSVGTSAIETDRWNVDGLAFVSYKGLRSPPGLSMVTISEKYSLGMEKCDRPNYSLSLKKALERSNLLMTASTAPVNSMILLERQVERILDRGLQNHYADCRMQAIAMRDALSQVGLEVFGREGVGNCITTTWVPQEIRHLDLVTILETDFQLYVGIGLGKLHGSTIRFAHYGDLGPSEIQFVSSCIDKTLRKYVYH